MEQSDFTPEQNAIIDLGPDARLIVDAPAGTGKTHVLAGRLANLVDRDGLEPGDEIVVLSFSRAAVLQLRSRLGRLGGDAAYATSSTFDSFASRLLAVDAPSDDWVALDFHGRIAAATELIGANDRPQTLRLVRHLLVDEVQDLAGVRAKFVLALIEQLDGGFTLFGDPAQAIYDYQAEDNTGLTTPQFYAAVTASSPTPVSRMALHKDFRSTLDARHGIAEVGCLLRGREPDQSRIQDRIRSLELRLPMVSLGAAKRSVVRDDGTTSAILCRTNGEALRVSSDLFRLGIAHAPQRRGDDRVVGAWLARVALGIRGVTASVSAIRTAWKDGPPPVDDILRDLRRMDPARGDSFDLGRIANRIRVGDIPEEVNETPLASLVVSTIHRAKGLEFDRVLVCETDWRADDDIGARNRLRYVALTRAKRDLFVVGAPNVSGLQLDRASGRWLRRGFGKHRWRVQEFEVVGSDASPAYPVLDNETPRDTLARQEYLLEVVRPGDAAELQLDKTQRVGHGYRIVHFGRVVGTTTDQFVDLLERVLGGGRLPSRVTGLQVEMIDTVAGDAMAARNAGLGSHGLWARPRVFGLGALEFDGALRGES